MTGLLPRRRAAKPRLVIFFPWPDLETMPSICGAATVLAGAGYDVEIVADERSTSMPSSLDADGIRVYSPLRHLPAVRGVLHATLRWLASARKHSRSGGAHWSDERAPTRRPRRGAIAARWIDELGEMWIFIRIMARHVRAPYAAVIGVDPPGIVRGHRLTRVVRVPLVYYSLELLPSGELESDWERRMKPKEVIASQASDLVIIQDDERAELLAMDNHLSRECFILVPNAPLGRASTVRDTWWHRRFRLASDIRVVLYAGSPGYWSALDEIVAAAASWKHPWALVVHFREIVPWAEEQRLRDLGSSGPVYFSTQPAPRQLYDELVSSAHIGVGFYRTDPLGSGWEKTNQQVIGLSSGKIAYYLRAGLPVVVNREASISTLIETRECGIVVEGATEISGALERIDATYDSFARAARATFNDLLCFEKAFVAVEARLRSLIVREAGGEGFAGDSELSGVLAAKSNGRANGAREVREQPTE